ncbi:hypothetical protein GJ496_010089 [Pomphorhynchus laevis]|nr:hypothetical protein GJ496_010089 [Pomphorhynchus laevis]
MMNLHRNLYSCVLKLYKDSDIRKTIVQPQSITNIEELRTIINEIVEENIKYEEYKLCYKDCDNDWVTLANNNDLQVAFELCETVIHLKLSKIQNNTPSTDATKSGMINTNIKEEITNREEADQSQNADVLQNVLSTCTDDQLVADFRYKTIQNDIFNQNINNVPSDRYCQPDEHSPLVHNTIERKANNQYNELQMEQGASGFKSPPPMVMNYYRPVIDNSVNGAGTPTNQNWPQNLNIHQVRSSPRGRNEFLIFNDPSSRYSTPSSQGHCGSSNNKASEIPPPQSIGSTTFQNQHTIYHGIVQGRSQNS